MRRFQKLAWRLAEPPGFLPPLAVQSLKVALASGLAWWLGQLVGSQRPFAAVLAVIILMQGHAYGSLLNAVQFLLGVAAGLVLGLLADRFLGVSPVVLAGVIFICMLMGGWLKVSRQGFNNQIAVSALLVLASGRADNIDRLWETALGGAVGIAVAALVWPPNPVRGLRQAYRKISLDVRSDVQRTLELAGTREAEANRRRVRDHSERADEAVSGMTEAEDALRWNPWHMGRIHDLSRLEDRLRLVAYLFRTVRALARQAAQASAADRASREWGEARPHLLAAGAAAVDAIERRLSGRDVRQAVSTARQAVAVFAVAAPQDRHAAALAAALDDLLSDVEGWRPPNQVRPDRQLVARILRRLGDRPGQEVPAPVRAAVKFEEERREAQHQELGAQLGRGSSSVPPLRQVVDTVGSSGEQDLGVRDISLAQITGADSHSPDFDPSFLPRSRHLQRRWVQLFERMERREEISPIEVYLVGDAYFVRKGHHRVSVARHLGWAKIKARVVELKTRAPIGGELNAEDLLRAAEYADFLERTALDKSRPQARLDCSQLGRYDVILDHIQGHRYFLAVQTRREPTLAEAAASWYDTVYRPLMDVVREREIDRRLPEWTEADIYLTLTRLWLDLEREGLPAGPEGAVTALLADPGLVAREARKYKRGRSTGRRKAAGWRRLLIDAVRSGNRR